VVAVDLAAVCARLAAVGAADRAAWEQIRALLLQMVGETCSRSGWKGSS
jgi:hypothetical protein